MKAGRELDALIAEKVMGVSRITWHPEGMYTGAGRPFDVSGKKPGQFPTVIDHYSTDLADAWLVVKQVLTWKHGHVDLSIEAEGVCCTISSYERDGQATAPSVPLAICLAALNAMESPS